MAPWFDARVGAPRHLYVSALPRQVVFELAWTYGDLNVFSCIQLMSKCLHL